MDEVKEEKKSRVKSAWLVYLMCLNASLGIFFFGFNQGVFNVVQLIILELKGVDDDDERSLYSGLMTSLNPLGGLVGALLGTYVLKCCGGLKKSFYLADVVGIIGTVIILIKVDIPNICVGRFIQGLAQGFNSALVPIYIKEFSPMEISGKTGSFAQLGQKGGLLMAYLFGLLLPSKKTLHDMADGKAGEEEYDNDYEWRIVIAIPIIFCLVRSLVLLTCFRLDTPTIMLQRHHEKDLKNFLHLIYKSADFEDAYDEALKKFHQIELHEMHEHEQEEKDKHHNVPQTDHNLHPDDPQAKYLEPVHQDEEHEHNQVLQIENNTDKKDQEQLNAEILHGTSGDIVKMKQPKKVFDGTRFQSGNINKQQQHDVVDTELIQEKKDFMAKLDEDDLEKEEREFEEIEKQTKCKRNMLGWFISFTVSFSGIDAIFYYSNSIFEDAGIEDYATLITICIGASAILFSFIGMFTVDQVGRRPLLVGGSFIMTASLVMLIVGDLIDQTGLLMVAILVFMFGYNTTLGPIKWAAWVEIMDSFGVSVAASLIFLMAFLIGLTFPIMVNALKLAGAFGVFLGCSVVCFFYLYTQFRETKGKNTRQIYKMFVKGYKPEKKEQKYSQNPNILELQGVSQITLSKMNADGSKKRMDLNSMHKSMHRSMHQSFHAAKAKAAKEEKY